MALYVMEEPGHSTAIDVTDQDLELVTAIRNGDTDAFEELVRRYDRQLLRIAHNLTHNLEDAEDVVQEAFLKAYLKLDQFQGSSKFSTWLMRILINQGLMKLRKRRDVQEISIDEPPKDDALPMDLADWSPDPEQLYGRSELREILSKALDRLTPRARVVFVLRDVEGLTIEETSTLLNLQPAAIKARLYRARLQLREVLARYFRQPVSAL